MNSATPAEAFGATLAKVRIRAGYTQSSLATALIACGVHGVRQARISEWELGTAVPGHQQAAALYGLLDVQPEELSQLAEQLVHADAHLRGLWARSRANRHQAP